MDNKILILGSGYIGSRLEKEFGAPVSNKIVSTYKEAEEEVLRYDPKILINCAGFTGKNVDECEKHLDTTLFSNTYLPIILSEVALRHNIKLVHISSGCIFNFNYDLDNPIPEDKSPDFLNLFYSRTKIYSEMALSPLLAKYPFLIVRIRIPLDNRPSPKNLLNKLISYKKVIDIPNSVTYIPDFVRALKHLIDAGSTGIFNLVNKGSLRYPKLMEIYKKYNPEFKYEVIDYKKLDLIRTNLILSTEKLEKTGFKVRDINDILEECVQQYMDYK